jgi:DNA recombination protein RmuC
MIETYGIIFAVICVSFVLGWLIASLRVTNKSRTIQDDYQLKLAQMTQQQLVDRQELGKLQQQAAQVATLTEELQDWQDKAQQQVSLNQELKGQLDAQTIRSEQADKSYHEKISVLESAEQRLTQQFENLANKIFSQKQESFSHSSKAGLDAMLTPLKEQIEGFKHQVSQQYNLEGQERASLKTEIQHLLSLNKQITEEASALTRALKGDNKKQGNWGEIILERVLQESGLREGHEYHIQGQFKDDSGKAFKPDVIVNLPNEKDVIIDAKMSLAAYERYFNADADDNLSETYLKEHITSVRQHIKALGSKNYQDLEGIRTLDYVLMFIPVEPAFLLAMEHAPDLVKTAFDENVMLVSPTNLLVALRTINHIWQYEYQNQNAEKIAERAGKLYDKFHGFVDDMEKIGRALDTTQKNYTGAINKLTDGRDNLVRQVERFRELGVQPNKRLGGPIADKGLENSNTD